MSNNEPQQDGENERKQARDDDVKVILINWIADWELLQRFCDDDRAIFGWILVKRVLRTGTMSTGRDISTATKR